MVRPCASRIGPDHSFACACSGGARFGHLFHHFSFTAWCWQEVHRLPCFDAPKGEWHLVQRLFYWKPQLCELYDLLDAVHCDLPQADLLEVGRCADVVVPLELSAWLETPPQEQAPHCSFSEFWELFEVRLCRSELDFRTERDYEPRELRIAPSFPGAPFLADDPPLGEVQAHGKVCGGYRPPFVRQATAAEDRPDPFDHEPQLPFDLAVALRPVRRGRSMHPCQFAGCSLQLLAVVGVEGLDLLAPDERLQCQLRVGRGLRGHTNELSPVGAFVVDHECGLLAADSFFRVFHHNHVIRHHKVPEGRGLLLGCRVSPPCLLLVCLCVLACLAVWVLWQVC